MSQPVTDTTSSKPGSLSEVARLAVKLGFLGFGGPAAHIAMLRDEVVVRRRWLPDAQFVDLLGATNLIPGPNSTEMVMHVGNVRAGWRGLVVAGTLFILPAASMVLALAWLYVEYGSKPAAGWLLYGVKPVIISIVAQALWGLLRTAVRGRLLAAVGLAGFALYLLGVNELALLFGAGLLVTLLRSAERLRAGPGALGVVPLPALAGPCISTWMPWLGQAVSAGSHDLTQLFLTCLKIGSVLYGSGYVLLAFLRGDFVDRLGWLSEAQLLDAVAIGQVTPGPLLTTVTFIGYIAAGPWGAVLATAGIFLPSFLFVAALNPLVPRLRRSRWMGAGLDGVNVAAVGLMAAVSWQLAREAIIDLPTAILAAASLTLLLRYRLNSVWLVLGGALLGVLYRLADG